MKTKIKAIFNITILMIMITSLSSIVFARSNDIEGHWATETISKFLEKKYINGYKDGSFKPDNQVTRAEFVRMVNKVMGFTKEGDISKYTDVPSDAWYYKDIKIAVGENYLKGTSESTISPEDKITREQAITIVARIYNLSGETDLTKYSDYKDISEYAVKPMQAMIKLGLVKGYKNGTLLPKKNLSRAEAVVLLDRITEKLGKLDPADDEKNPEINNGNKPAVDDENKQPEKPRPIKPRPNRPKRVNKTALIKAIEAGKAIQNDVLYTNADQALKDALLKAIENGEKVKDSIKASQKDVNEATKAINDAIDKLNGNKTTIAESYTPTGLDPKVLVNNINALTDEEKNEVINALKEANKDLPQGTTITVDDTGKATFTYSDKSTDEILGKDLVLAKTNDEADILREENTKIVDLNWAQYVSIDFIEPPTDNKNIAGSYKVEIDGVDITEDLRPVSDDSRLVKWELTSLNPKELIATRLSDGKTETVKLSDNQNPTPPVLKGNMSVKYFLSRGPLTYFEYQKRNYDENGNLRMEPGKTTFGFKQDDTSIPKHYVEKSEMDAYGEGEISILFEYQAPNYKNWVDNINKVDLLEDTDSNNLIKENIPFELIKNAEHGNHKVGQLKITTGKKNFKSTGRYKLKIYSGGKTKFININLVNIKAPVMRLETAGDVKSGTDIRFDIVGMRIKPGDQIDRVILKEPTGLQKEIPLFQYQYYVDKLVLYNTEKDQDGNIINHIPYNGEYTLRVETAGYKDVETKFTVIEGIDIPSNKANTLDAVSRATGGSSSGGSSGGSGSLMTPTNIIFNGDLVINALIIKDLGLEYPYAKEIADRFDYEISGLEPMYVLSHSFEPKYDKYDFANAVQNAKLNGTYLSFEEYKENGKIDLYTLYSFKEILEDNLLGDIRYFNQEIGLNATFTLVNDQGMKAEKFKENQKVNIKVEPKELLNHLENLRLNLSSLPVSPAKYMIKDNIISIDGDVFPIGNSMISLQSKGYKQGNIHIYVEKDIKKVGLVPLKSTEDISTLKYEKGNPVRIMAVGEDKDISKGDPSKGDFLKHLHAIVLTKPNGEKISLRPSSPGIINQDDYYIKDTSILTIRPGAFKDIGKYSVAIESNYYGIKTVSFDIEAKPGTGLEVPEELKEPVRPVKVEIPKNSFLFTSGLKFKWETGGGDIEVPYVSAINKIEFNGIMLIKAANTAPRTQAFQTNGGVNAIEFTKDIKLEENNIIVLEAEGYKDLTIEIDKNGEIK